MAVILVVDDDRSIIESFKELFRDEYTVLGAYNELEIIDIINNNNIDIIFLDYRLPGKNGLELLKLLKNINPEIYIIIITGYGNFETKNKALKFGAYDYLEKPLNIDKIINITDNILTFKIKNSMALNINN